MAELKRPFHETIVEAIDRAATVDELKSLGRLLKKTVIPSNHDQIIATWNRICDDFGLDKSYDGVASEVISQKPTPEEGGA